MPFTTDDLDKAYRKLKSLVYYDKTDLRLRARLAAFECAEDFEARLEVVRDVLNSESPSKSRRFKGWLKDIGFRVVPKKLSASPRDEAMSAPEHGRLITNVTTTKVIEVEKVNYFFDGAIELHLIAVLWVMTDGKQLDAQLAPECCGSRLSNKLNRVTDESLELFTKYHEQYARWRDTGIRKAKQLLVDEQRNVAILGLDIQEYFYRINVDFGEVAQALPISIQAKEEAEDRGIQLLACIEAIGQAYRECIDPMLSKTHPTIDKSTTGLPIGLCSSLVLANWYLQGFDSAVLKRIRPAYYGRYVDDILVVVPVPVDPTEDDEDPIGTFIHSLLVGPRILNDLAGGAYEIRARPGLLLQQSKCILQYFDARHSIAGLEKFQKKLEENGSDFLLLPVDEADNSMEDVAYELLYEGSVNKFRSVKGLAENRYELAKHLARQTVLHLVTDDPPDRKVSKGLQQFFKGRSAIEFFDLWERVFTLLGIAGDKVTMRSFVKQLKVELRRVKNHHDAVTLQLQADLEQHLELALAMSDAVCAQDFGFSELLDGIHSEELRRSNLLRHHFVRAPLLNYTTYAGPLSTRKLNEVVQIDLRKLERSPRFVNFDECMLLAYSGNVDTKKSRPFVFASKVYKRANRAEIGGVKWPKKSAGAED